MTKHLLTVALFSAVAFGQSAPLSLVVTGDCNQTTVPGNLVITNNSNQTILAVVIRIDAYCFQRNELYVHDFFFKQVAFAPNMTVNHRLPTMGSEMKDLPSPPQLPLQATVLYVQFADGTTYGDTAYGKALRSQRPRVIDLLQQVQAASTSLAAVQNVLAPASTCRNY